MSLAYDDRGQGPVVVLLHGFPLDRTMWSGQVDDLSTSFRLILPDLPGHGGSPVAPGVVTMEAMADAVVGLLDELGLTGPVVLGGLSMGGYVALEALARHPGRFRALMLLDTRATPDTPEAAANREVLARKVEEAGYAQPVIDAMRPKLVSKTTQDRAPAIVEELVQVMARTPTAGIAGALRGMAVRPDRTADLVGSGLPTLILVGADDVITPPAEMQGLAAAVPGSRFATIPEAGHLAPREQPAACNREIRSFLGELS